MKIVFCGEDFCIYNEYGQCTKDVISIGQENDFCEDFVDYLDTEEYSNKYYVAVKTENGIVAKGLKKGKRFEYQGLVFYTEDRVFDDDINVTEETTGMIAPFEMVKKHFDKVVARIEISPKVKYLPLAEEHGGKWKLKNEVTENE